MLTLTRLSLLLVTCCILSAQNVKEIKQDDSNYPDKSTTKHFQGYNPTYGACISPDQRAKIVEDAKAEISRLRAKGTLMSDNASFKNVGSFQWPLRSNNYDACGYYSIFQYFDHDPAYGSVQDWNCGTITYDVPGYNHSGTDIGIGPFPWNMMDAGNVEVIAIADGQIIQRVDGNFDMECNASSFTWNYLLVQHADGSYAMYGHMKNGSLTSLQIGDEISTGDYIGLVGSSGASTGPHLHLEILEAGSMNSIDPYAGPCNNQIGSSMWANQHPYYEKGINRVMTHSAPPNSNTCPSLATINEQTQFEPGSQIYLGAYLRHALPTDTYTMTLNRPDGTSYWTNDQVPSNFFASYMFYFSTYISNFEQTGQWTLNVESSYGDACSTSFYVGDCDDDISLSLPVPDGMVQPAVQAANSITSTAVINSGANVTYDAGNCIDLQSGFEVKQNAQFEAFLDGCGGQ